jgi:LAO/AO transport system kinase
MALSGTAGDARRLGIAMFRLRKTAETLLLERFNASAAALAPAAAQRLTRRDGDPYSLAAELVAATQTGWMS